MRKHVELLLGLLFVSLITGAQETKPAFWEDIQAFRTQDSIKFPPRNAILFIGSSSFTMWQDVRDYFPGYTIINRGFGGSSLPDQIRYEKDIIFPYRPKQVVIYCGENDLAGSDTVTGEMVFQRFKVLFNDIRKKLPDASIAYVSMKPSPSRQHLRAKMERGNLLIRNFLKTKPKTAFIDVYHKMLNADKSVMKDIFLEDELHMNKKGYSIWQKAIRPYLRK